MRRVLDLAWEREIGIKLCLWSFDMLRLSNSSTVLTRNRLLLMDTTYTRAYINNSLIPMVNSLKRHPAIIAWEILNEPEGMSNEFGWSDIQHVPMSAIQRFVNLCAGAIHRVDTSALVTNGSWSFRALTDVPNIMLGASDSDPSELNFAQREELKDQFNKKYRMSLETDEVIQYLQRVSSIENYNYYSDSRLIAEGGDPRGTLDFYSVHFYEGLGSAVSPFTHRSGDWGLTKAIVVAEFATTQNLPGQPRPQLYDALYRTGYAGALAWSWTDVNFSPHADMLASMRYMWNNHRTDVDVLGIGGDFPNVTITSPRADTTFASLAAASDSDGTIASVKFFYADTALIGERTAPPYSVTWTNASNGIYTLTAVATDDQGHQRTSNTVRISVGRPIMKKFEAEAAIRQGSGIASRSDPTASGNAHLDITAANTNTRVTWQIVNVSTAGTYEIAFGYKLFYATPKSQYINVNGVRAATLEFTAPSTATWYEKTMNVDLVPGNNTIQMQMFWAWMYLDYLSVPLSIVPPVETPTGFPGCFSLQQNYPNPFNSTTEIRYQIPEASQVTLKIFDILGSEVKTLINETKTAGRYAEAFDGTGLASGVYLYRLQANDHFASKKMIILK
jgi:5-hydroxyisourate hydrolase-like protein (transthyretin family)